MKEIKNRSAVLMSIVSCIVIIMLFVFFSSFSITKGTYGVTDDANSGEDISNGVCYLCLGSKGSVINDGYYVWSSDGSVPVGKDCHKNINGIDSESDCEKVATPSPNLYECTINPVDSTDKVCIKAYDSPWASASLGDTGMSCVKVTKCSCEYTSAEDCESKNAGYTCKKDEETGCFVKDTKKCSEGTYLTEGECEKANSNYNCKEENGCWKKAGKKVDDKTPAPSSPSSSSSSSSSSKPSSSSSSSSTVSKKPSSSSNVDKNPPTGSVAMFMVWIISIGVIIYAFFYFKQSRFE